MKRLKLTFAVLFLIPAFAAVADPIVVNGGVVTNPDGSENFDAGFTESGVSDQFAASGLTFVTNSGSGSAIISNNQCSNGTVTGLYLYPSVSAPCWAAGNASTSILFGGTVSEVSWVGWLYNRYSVERLYDGAVLAIDSGNYGHGQFLLTGVEFDELRVSGRCCHMAIDELAWKYADATVPEPGTFALLVLGLAGISFARRKTV